MKPSSELFDLIHSLNQTEKRYFKVYAAKNASEQSIYLRLFDAIDAQQKYDEQEIRSRFKNEQFTRQLHVAKNYLYSIILKSLTAYHAKTSINAQVLDMLRSVEVLYEKGFYKQCEKLLSKVKKLCRDYEKRILYAQCCEWEARLASRKSEVNHVSRITEEEQASLTAKIEILEYKKKAFSIYEKILQLGVVRDKDELASFKKEIEAPLLKRADQLLTNEARYYKYSALGLYASTTGNKKQHYTYSKKIFDLFELHPALKEEYPFHYIGSLNNLCNALFQLERNAEVLKLVEKLRDFCNAFTVNKWEDVYLTGLLLSHDIEITAYMNTGQFHKILAVVKPVEELLKVHKLRFKKSYLLDLIYDLAYGLFIAKEYELSLTWLLKILNEPNLFIRKDVYSASRILHLLLHYELGNELLLRNIIKPTAKFLERKKRLYLPERILLRALETQIKTKDAGKRMATFQSLKTEIHQALKKPFDKRVLNYLDIPTWIESKIQGRDMRDLLKQKA